MPDYIDRDLALNMELSVECEPEELQLLMTGMNLVLEHIKGLPSVSVCQHYRPNHHDRGDDSLCEKYHCEVKALPRWIPAETLPPEDVYVLAIDQNGYYGIGYNSGECFADGHREWFAGDYRFEKPTHWMPLPPPPKGEE